MDLAEQGRPMTAAFQDDAPTVPASGQAVQPELPSHPLAVFHQRDLPRWALVRQRLDATVIEDVPEAVNAALRSVAHLIHPGQRVCLAVGSRGIDRIADVVRAAVLAIRELGGQVFVVPAMGSHGGATAAGQLDVLASLGITPETIGCDIRSRMDAVQIGRIEGRIPVFFDRHALDEADAVIPINRVKPHTDFTAEVESGLLKMIAIGLGKQRGAEALHAEGFAAFGRVIPAVAAYTIGRINIPFGLALIENGHARLRRIEAVPASVMLDREPSLRDEADRYLARLPVDAIDVLILDRIGKDISGLRMDSNVVGRYYTGPTGAGPAIQRIIVRDLTDKTQGNAVGIGMADVVLRRAVERMDPVKTYMNCVTAKTPEGARIALTVESDREALDVAIACCAGVDPMKVRLARIRDTKNVEWFYASEPLLEQLKARGNCELVGKPMPIRFDSAAMFRDELPR